MLAMHLNNRTKISSSRNGYPLPGFRDFLREVEPGRLGSFDSLPSINTSTAACSGKSKLFLNQDDLYPCFLTHSTQLPVPSSVFVPLESGPGLQGLGIPQLSYAQRNHSSASGGTQNRILLEKDAGSSIRPCEASSPFRLSRSLLPPVVTPEEPRLRRESSTNKSSSGKIASNHKHKQSEKHRRDEMGAYVQAAELIRGSLHPGILSDCSFCIADTLLNEKLCSSSMYSENVAVMTVGTAPKRTRNQTLEEALMWQFSIVLHFRPQDVGSRLDDIRAAVEQIRSENFIAKVNESTNSKKSDMDARVEVLADIVQKMRYACELHDVPHCACGRHEAEDWSAEPLTTLAISECSSSGSTRSSRICQKRSTTTIDDHHEDDRRIKRRNINHFQK